MDLIHGRRSRKTPANGASARGDVDNAGISTLLQQIDERFREEVRPGGVGVEGISKGFAIDLGEGGDRCVVDEDVEFAVVGSYGACRRRDGGVV